ncbi:hypothetical protein [Novosphingobium sp. B1]|uniref:hypothetical protein n=1 Tax=Novosphingobium sp. B1 TaxID=1938756 RepID=UPI00111C69D7|nr:hypothetical protein [Novosphingobium sp. B1]
MTFNDPGAFVTADPVSGLRPMTWHGLCARIVAAQDLRRVLEAGGDSDAAAATGSFHGAAARLITSGFPGVSTVVEEGNRRVNPTSSVNGKSDLATSGGTYPATRPGAWPHRAEPRD